LGTETHGDNERRDYRKIDKRCFSKERGHEKDTGVASKKSRHLADAPLVKSSER